MREWRQDFSCGGEDERGIGSTEAQIHAEHGRLGQFIPWSRQVGSEFRDRMCGIDLRGDISRAEALERKDGLECASGSQRVADCRFCGADAHSGEILGKHASKGSSLRSVVKDRRRAMGVEVANLGRLEPCLLKGALDGTFQRSSCWVGLGDVVCVRRMAVACEAAFNFCAAFVRMR